MADFKKGDKVKCSAEYNYDNSKHLASFVRVNTYDVIQVNGDRVVIGIGNAVTAAVNAQYLTKIGGTDTPITPSTPAETPAPAPQPPQYEESAMTSEGIEDELAKFLNAGGSEDMLKFNMRLFGVPHQFTQYCDYRTYSADHDAYVAIGRKFIENIFLEAPVLTIIPGKPIYLPAAKNKTGITYGLLNSANGNLAELAASIDSEKLNEKLRYYDFQADYYKYIQYVNILCAVSAAFLDLQNVMLDGKSLISYRWQNYRWNDTSYRNAAANIVMNGGYTAKTILSGLGNLMKQSGEMVLDAIDGSKSSGTGITAFTDVDEDEDLMDALNDVLMSNQFVQFYIDAKSGASESGDNTTSPSKLEGMLESGSELMKEVAFVANSGGIDAESLQKMGSDALDAASSMLTNSMGSSGISGSIGGILGRLLSTGSSVIMGDNMVFPEIYQSSSFSKNYNVTVDLRSPYGNRLSYFLNVLVPLWHLIALAIPKQTTANTYGSPFLIKAYYPGAFSCNLGIIQSIQIDKNPDGDAWSVDGFPTEIKVTITIKDLYSDLNITPSGDITLFLANSSLIEYIAINCGINMVAPKLLTRAKALSAVVTDVFSSIPGNVEDAVFGSLDSWIASLIGV